MNVNVILFDGFTSLDFIGPVEALQRIEDYTVRYYSPSGGLVSNGGAFSVLTEPFSQLENGILLIPGGWGTRRLVEDQTFICAIKAMVQESTFCLTVCTGAALLAKTGLLDGRAATSNKLAMPWVKSVAPRVNWQGKARWVVSGRYYTSSGVSAGMDMALGFIADQWGREKAEAIAKRMEYLWNDVSSNDPFCREDSNGSITQIGH